MTRARIVLAAALLIGSSCGGASPATRTSATDFALRDIDGQTVHLSDYVGNGIVLLDFWATWCGPCMAELPQLDVVYQKYKDRGFVVLAVAMDGPATVANVAPQARRMGLTFPVLLDEETRVVAAYNPRSVSPFMVLFDKNGTIVTSREGFAGPDGESLEADVRALLR